LIVLLFRKSVKKSGCQSKSSFLHGPGQGTCSGCETTYLSLDEEIGKKFGLQSELICWNDPMQVLCAINSIKLICLKLKE
jgi:hypothetical protein